jgi:hypothetical protein
MLCTVSSMRSLLMKPHVKEWEHYWNLVLLMEP